MHALKLRCRAGEKDWISAELWSLGTEGITEIDQPDGSIVLEAFFADRIDTREFRLFEPEWIEHGEQDWAEAWKQKWEPLLVGRRWFLVPDWRDDPAPARRLRLVVHARQASGSGYQPATQLALEAIEEFVHPKDRFLDWGCGSGILSSAAHLLHAAEVVACDVDPDAAWEARANFESRGVPALLFVGSGRALRGGHFDVVAANMNAAAILSCHEDLVRVARIGGRLILSGFKERRSGSLRAAFQKAGLRMVREYRQEDWRCLVLS